MMRQPGSERPAFATFEVEHVDKADGRKVHYYTWPPAPDGESEPGTADASDAVDAVDAVDAAPRPATSAADGTPSARPDRV